MLPTTKAIRVALIHPLHAWVDALETLLAPQDDIEVIAAHTTADWARHAVAGGGAELLLINIDGSSVDGPAVMTSLRAERSDLGIVVISDSEDPTLLATAVRAGARGWVSQTASFDHLVTVMRGVAHGETWFPPHLLSVVLDSLLNAEEARQQESAVLSALSAREVEVLRCLTQGLTRQQIAERYFLSPHTVRTHINNVLRKLEVHSTLAAVSIARQVGLADNEQDRRSS
ncbi:MAG: response regulator transcription factor [Nocardioidaceae bacterium]